MTRKTLVLILLLVFSFTIRFWQLDKNPIGFFCDEASVGYDALSIIKTGRDRKGDFLPLFFKGFNFDNVSPYQVYLTLPFVGLFGLNEKAVRLAPVFWSTMEIFLFYLLLCELIPEQFALIGALFLSISPWHFHLSRTNMGDYYSWTFFTILSYFFLIKALKTSRLNFFILSAIFFGLTNYSYTPARLITPFLFSLTLSIVLLRKKFKMIGFMVLTYVVVLMPFLYFHLTNPYSLQRIKDTVGVDLKNYRNGYRIDGSNLGSFWSKYRLYYSDLFLFQKGDTDFPGQFIRRHSIAGLGLLYPYQKFFVLGGLIWLIIRLIFKKSYELLFVVFLLILFPVAGSLTNDKVPFATRAYLGVLPFQILFTFGINGISEILEKLPILKKKSVFIILFFVLLILFPLSTYTLLTNFKKNPLSTSDYWGWQYGPREIIKYFKTVEHTYDDLFMIGEFNAPEIFIRFYAPESCRNCQIGNFENYNSTRRQIFAVTPNYLASSHLKDKFEIKKKIFYPDNSLAFVIGEINPSKK